MNAGRPVSDEELRPYGYQPGNVPRRWCACCGFHFEGAQKAFKCRPCARDQSNEVERNLKSREADQDLRASKRG